MTDLIDVAQRRQQEEIDHALAARKPAGIGATHCEQADCGEPISTFRQDMGARLCVDCQRDAEARACQRRGA